MIFGKRKSNPRLIRSKNNIEKRRDFGESYLEISSGICSGAVPSDFLKSLYLCEDSLITDYWLQGPILSSIVRLKNILMFRSVKINVAWAGLTRTRLARHGLGQACGSHRMTLKKKKKTVWAFFSFDLR